MCVPMNLLLLHCAIVIWLRAFKIGPTEIKAMFNLTQAYAYATTNQTPVGC